MLSVGVRTHNHALILHLLSSFVRSAFSFVCVDGSLSLDLLIVARYSLLRTCSFWIFEGALAGGCVHFGSNVVIFLRRTGGDRAIMQTWWPLDDDLRPKPQYIRVSVGRALETASDIVTPQFAAAHDAFVSDFEAHQTVFGERTLLLCIWWRRLFWLICECGVDGLGETAERLLAEIEKARKCVDILRLQLPVYKPIMFPEEYHGRALATLVQDLAYIENSIKAPLPAGAFDCICCSDRDCRAFVDDISSHQPSSVHVWGRSARQNQFCRVSARSGRRVVVEARPRSTRRSVPASCSAGWFDLRGRRAPRVLQPSRQQHERPWPLSCSSASFAEPGRVATPTHCCCLS